jgi:hypothetical protein
MAGYGYGYGGFGGNIYQQSEQERIGYGPQGYVIAVVFDCSTPLSLQIRIL